MTAFWTQPAGAIDAALNERFADLASSLTAIYGKPVVLHDGQGHYAPVIADSERLHVQIHAVPRRASTETMDPPRASNPLRRHRLANYEIPRLAAATRTREVINLHCHVDHDGTVIAQQIAQTLFVLLQPSCLSEERAATELRDVLFHLAFSRLLRRDAANATEFRPDHHGLLRARFSNMQAGHLTRAAVDFPVLRDLARQALIGQLPQAVARTLHRLAGRRQGDTQRLLQSKRADLRRAQNNLESAERALETERSERQTRLAQQGRTGAAPEMRAELESILGLPQVIGLRLSRPDRTPFLEVDFRPMALAPESRRNGVKVLSPMRLRLALDPHSRRVEMDDIYNSHLPSPHVREHICFGNMGEAIEECLRERQYATAVQLMIGFAQTYNQSDAWGAAGAHWPAFDVQPGPGNVVLLADPAA